jgi:phage gp36-like protein
LAYATQDDLVPLRMTQKDLAEITVDEPSGDDAVDAAVTASMVSKAIAEASGRVESYCRQRYVTPLQESEDVKALTLDIVIYLLFSRRRTTRVSETVQERFNQAIGFLKDVSRGAASLDQPVTAALPQQGSGEAVVTRRPERFSDSNLDGYAGGERDVRTGTIPNWWGM